MENDNIVSEEKRIANVFTGNPSKYLQSKIDMFYKKNQSYKKPLEKIINIMIDKCRFSGLRGLVLSMANTDYSCEHCGEWQEAILNRAWEITTYKEESNA